MTIGSCPTAPFPVKKNVSLNPSKTLCCNVFPCFLFFFFSYRGAVCNVLLTCCKDSVCRLWAETLLPGDSLISGYHSNHLSSPNGEMSNSTWSSSKHTCNGKTSGMSSQEVCNCNYWQQSQKIVTKLVNLYFWEFSNFRREIVKEKSWRKNTATFQKQKLKNVCLHLGGCFMTQRFSSLLLNV